MKTLALALGLAVAVLSCGFAAPAVGPPLWATLVDAPAMPKPDESGFIINGGARLYYAVFHKGGGRPVVLLHGGLASSDSWGFEAPRLARSHEVIVIDTRGHGRSTRPEGPLSYDQMEQDVIAVLDGLHVRRASAVGVSDGGIVGLILAIHDPQRLDRLFAWGANFRTHAEPAGPPDPALRAVGAVYMARVEADYRKLSTTPGGFADLRKALGQLYGSQPDLQPADLGRITAPTVIADGDHEQFISREHTELLARSIPNARLIIIPNVSHGGALQNPEAFHRAVASLLDPS